MDDSTPIIDVTPHPAGFVPPDDIWAFLRRRKGLIAVFWLIGIAIAFWWLLSRPGLYEAESRIMIVRTGSGGPVSEAELASEIELIRDPSHLKNAAAKEISSGSGARIHAFEAKIHSALSVAPAGNSNLVAIQYRDTDPGAAVRIVNQIVELYLAGRRSIFESGGGHSPSGSSTPAAEKLSAFDARNHGTQLRTELENRVQRRIELESRVAEFKAQIRDHQEAAATLRKRFAGLPDRIHSRTRTTVNPSLKQVEETEVVNPLKQQVESQILSNDTAAAGLRARLYETAGTLRDARVLEDRASALTSERDELQRKAITEGGAADPASPNERANLRATLINRAEPPYGPLAQRRWLWMPAALLATLLAALLIAWLIDQFDKPIYTSHEFERASGVPPIDDFAQGDGV